MKFKFFFMLILLVCLSFCLGYFTKEHLIYEIIPKPYPADRISLKQISVYEKGICIEGIKNFSLATYTDSHSMESTLGYKTNGIEIKPESPSQIRIGDIISYKYGDDLIVHRVINTSKDNKGWYAITKGDNINEADPLRIRFDDINGVLVAILY